MSNRKSSRYNSMAPRNFNPKKCAECESLRLEIDDLAAKLNQLTAQVTSQSNQLTALEGTVLIDWIRNIKDSIDRNKCLIFVSTV